MRFVPGSFEGNAIREHDKLIRRYLAEHESEWRDLRGFRWLLARFRAERRAWKYAREKLAGDWNPYKLY